MNTLKVLTYFLALAHGLGNLALANVRAVPPKQKLSVWIDSLGKLPYLNNQAPPYSEHSLYAAVLGSLLQTDKSYNLQPYFLRAWNWDHKDNAYLLELRDDLLFHNGRKVTSEDVEFSILRGALSGPDNYFRVFFSNIVGYQALVPGTKYQSQMIDGIKILDPLRLKIRLGAPNPSFLHNLSYTFCSLVPKEALASDYMTWKTLPIGAGPFRVIGVEEANRVIHLEKFDGKLDQKVPDEIALSTAEFPKQEDLALWNWDPMGPKFTRVVGDHADAVIFILFNYNHPLGKDERFRRAVSLAVDKSALTQGFDYLAPTYNFLPSHFWGRAKLSGATDLAQAKALLKSLPKDLQTLLKKSIRVPVRATMKPQAAFTRLEKQLRNAGLDVTLHADPKKYWDHTHAETLMWIVSFVMGDVDPVLKFGVLRESGPLRPFVPSGEKMLETLYQQAAQASSLDIRVDTVSKLSKYVYDKSLVVPLMERKPVHWYNPEKVADLGVQDGGYWFYLERVRLK